jgi:hypothetical protein
MDQGEAMTPVPEGKITTTATWKEPESKIEEAIKEADLEEAVEEYLPDEVVEK